MQIPQVLRDMEAVAIICALWKNTKNQKTRCQIINMFLLFSPGISAPTRCVPKLLRFFCSEMESWLYIFTLYVIQIYDVLIKHKETQAEHTSVHFRRRPRTFLGNQQNVQNIFVFALRVSGRKSWECFLLKFTHYKKTQKNRKRVAKYVLCFAYFPNGILHQPVVSQNGCDFSAVKWRVDCTFHIVCDSNIQCFNKT